MQDGSVGEAVQLLHASVRGLLERDLSAATDAALLAELAEVERARRMLDAVDAAQLAELDRRGVGSAHGFVNTPALLSELLHVSPSEAKGRVSRARDLGPRAELTGAPLPPIYPVVATAQRAGEICAEQIRVIDKAIDRLPADTPLDTVEHAEVFLVEQARHLDARRLAAVAARLVATLDPDGARPREEERQRHRTLAVQRTNDGRFLLRGELTDEFVAAWTPILDTLSRPLPVDDAGTEDPRSPGQRRHDAMLEAGKRLLRSGTLPNSGGVPATLGVTLTGDQLRVYEAGRPATATTDAGDIVSAEEALRWTEDGEIHTTVLSPSGGILSYGRGRRTASPGQRRAMAHRDKGCSFPGCTRPPSWCEAHHAPAWAGDGQTDTDTMVLLCSYHHRHHEQLGWSVQIRDGVPEWIPPAWLDEQRRPRRNGAHHLPEFTFATAS